MVQLGSADLLFTALFLSSLAAFDRAGGRPRMYLLAGLFLGLASLTRYNGLLLYGFYPLFVLWKRPRHFRSVAFWTGMALAVGLAGLWFLRNALTFGNPFFTAYGTEYRAEVPSIWLLIMANIRYYIGPFHNVLPVLLLLGLWGVLRYGRRQPLLLLGIIAGSALALLWWVRGIRFAFPGYPIFLGFAAIGFLDLWRRWKRWRLLILVGAMLTIVLHAGALCLYSYGACNAWFDRTVDHIPPDLNISSEGLYGFSLARDYIDAEAPSGAAVLVDSPNYFTWRTRVFRPDLRIVQGLAEQCPAYEIVQGHGSDGALFTTASAPETSVFLRPCP
jgi:4-amino-4-deoxy-L-arabinose transferase-like glycosyltransferase